MTTKTSKPIPVWVVKVRKRIRRVDMRRLDANWYANMLDVCYPQGGIVTVKKMLLVEPSKKPKTKKGEG